MSKRTLLSASLLLILLTATIGQPTEGQGTQAPGGSPKKIASPEEQDTAAPVNAEVTESPAVGEQEGATPKPTPAGSTEKTVKQEATGGGASQSTTQTTTNKASTTTTTTQGASETPGDEEGEKFTSEYVSVDKAEVLKWSGDLNPAGACEIDKGTYCRNLKFGEQRVLRCLTMQLVRRWDGEDNGIITPRCLEEMMEYKIQHTQSINGDIELAKACSKDAETFCQNPEKYQGSSQGGAVVACLRNQRDSLAPACQQEIFRVMREAAYDFRLDAKLHEKCKEEVKDYCLKTPPGEGRIVECLHKAAFHQMENKECKNEILRQLRETSGDVRLNHHLYQACNSEMQKFCRGIQPGEQKMQICLAEARDEEGFGTKCGAAVVELLGHLIEDAREDKLLTEGCATDLKALCDFDEEDENADHGELLACLSKNREKLHKSCIGEVSRLLKEQFRNINLNPKLQDGCGEDIKHHCADTVEDEGLTVECLVEHRNNLTITCGKLLFEQRIVRNQSIAYNMVLRKACAKDQQTFCKNVDVGEGRVIQCLMQNFDKKDMSMMCKKALSGLARDEAEDYRLDPELQKACKDDAMKLCRGKCDPEDNTESCDGKVIACLEYNTVGEEGGRMEVGTADENPVNSESPVSEECQRMLSFRTRMQAADFRNNEVLADSCHDNAQKLCLDESLENPVKPGDGRIFDCLFDNFPVLSKACQDEELKFKIMQSESVDRLPHLFKVCQMETAFFCSKVTPTGGKVLECLETNVESDPSHFNAECKEALSGRTENLQKDYRFDKGLRKHCKHAARKFDCAKLKSENRNKGKIFMCLVQHYDKLLDDRQDSKCAGEMSRVVRQSFFHYQKGGAVTSVCDADLESICNSREQKVGMQPGEYTRCLAEYLREHETMPSPQCEMLVAIGKTQPPSNDGQNVVKEKDLKQHLEDSNKALGEKFVSLTNQLKQEQAAKASARENEMDKNTLIGVVALFGVLILAAVIGAIWAIRKYLSKGYMVLKSGDV